MYLYGNASLLKSHQEYSQTNAIITHINEIHNDENNMY